MVDLTGAGASLGAQQKQVADLWAEKLSRESIAGRKVEVLVRDNRSDPAEAARAVGELVNTERVDIVLGPTRTGTSLAMTPVATGAKVPMISWAPSKAIVEKDGKQQAWIFKTAQGDDVVMERMVEVMGRRGHRRVALLRDSSALGEGVKELMDEKGRVSGVAPVKIIRFATTGTDFTPQLVEARDARPDALLVWGIPPSAATINKQAATLAGGVPVYQIHGVANADFLRQGGPEVNGTTVIAGRLVVGAQVSDSDPHKKAITSFITEFKGRYGQEPNGFAGIAHDAFSLAVEALKKGGPSREQARNWLDHGELVGVSGSFKFRPDDHSGLTRDSMVELRVENGAFKLV